MARLVKQMVMEEIAKRNGTSSSVASSPESVETVKQSADQPAVADYDDSDLPF